MSPCYQGEKQLLIFTRRATTTSYRPIQYPASGKGESPTFPSGDTRRVMFPRQPPAEPAGEYEEASSGAVELFVVRWVASCWPSDGGCRLPQPRPWTWACGSCCAADTDIHRTPAQTRSSPHQSQSGFLSSFCASLLLLFGTFACVFTRNKLSLPCLIMFFPWFYQGFDSQIEQVRKASLFF